MEESDVASNIPLTQYLEMLSIEALHFPISQPITYPTTLSLHPNYRSEEVLGYAFGKPTWRMNDVLGVAILKVYRDGISFAADSYRDAFEKSNLLNRAKFNLISRVTPWEFEDLRSPRIDEDPIRVVFYKALINFFESTTRLGGPLIELYSAEPITNLWLSLPINPYDWNGTSLFYTREMDICMFSHHSGEISQILRQPSQRNGFWAEGVDLKSILPWILCLTRQSSLQKVPQLQN